MAAPAAAPGEGKRSEGDEWCDSGLGSLGEGQAEPLPPSPEPPSPAPTPPRGPGEEEEEEEEEGGGGGAGGDPAAWVRRVLSFVTEEGDTALHLAVIHEHEAFLDSILQHTGGSQYLDLQNDLGQTALHIAVILGLPGVVGKLRGAGAGVSLREWGGGQTPLHLACREGHPECARQLLGTPPTPPGTNPPPQNRRERENKEQLESLNYDGFTPLHLAVLRKDPELVELLLRAGADSNRAEPSCGRSPLHLAVEAQSPEVAECLLRGGADPAPRMFVGYTPLYSARRRPDPRLPLLLQRFGAQEPPGDSEEEEEEEEEEEDESDDDDEEPSEEEYDDIVINSGRCPD